MIIIGITGTLGAGKGEIVSYLKSKGFNHLSVRAFLAEEIARRGLPYTRESAVNVGNELRKTHFPGYIIEQLYNLAKVINKDCVIESLRAPGEIEFLQQHQPFYLIAVDADPQVRYKRIRERKGEFDDISYETFQEQEAREMTSIDPSKQNLAECMRRADFRIDDDVTIEELHAKVDEVLEKVKLPK